MGTCTTTSTNYSSTGDYASDYIKFDTTSIGTAQGIDYWDGTGTAGGGILHIDRNATFNNDVNIKWDDTTTGRLQSKIKELEDTLNALRVKVTVLENENIQLKRKKDPFYDVETNIDKILKELNAVCKC